MKIQYIGDGFNPPLKTSAMGYDFDLGGAAVDVDNAKAAAKLSGNPTFRVVEGKSASAETQNKLDDTTPTHPTYDQMVAFLKEKGIKAGRKKADVEAAYLKATAVGE